MMNVPIEIPDSPTASMEVFKRRCLRWFPTYDRNRCKQCHNRFYCHPTPFAAKLLNIEPVNGEYDERYWENGRFTC